MIYRGGYSSRWCGRNGFDFRTQCVHGWLDLKVDGLIGSGRRYLHGPRGQHGTVSTWMLMVPRQPCTSVLSSIWKKVIVPSTAGRVPTKWNARSTRAASFDVFGFVEVVKASCSYKIVAAGQHDFGFNVMLASIEPRCRLQLIIYCGFLGTSMKLKGPHLDRPIMIED